MFVSEVEKISPGAESRRPDFRCSRPARGVADLEINNSK